MCELRARALQAWQVYAHELTPFAVCLSPAQIPIIMVWNKLDLANDPDELRRRAALQAQPTVCISAATGEGLPALWKMVQAAVEQQTLVSLECLLPHEHSHLLGKIRRLGAVEREEYDDAGVLVRAKVPSSLAGQLMQWRRS
jgi:GTP-binding protein HflX